MRKILILLCFVGLAFTGCDRGKPSYKKADQDENDQLFRQAGDLAGSHILIAYKGAERAEATRSKEEAKRLAEAILGQVQREPDKFESIAREKSDDKGSAAQGGDLGAWPTGSMVPDFEIAVRQAGVGKVYDKLVETPFGFHIIRRNSRKTKFFGGWAIIIGYKTEQTPQFKRSKEEAKKLADELAGKINAGNFEQLAVTYNDLEKGATYWKPFTKFDQGIPTDAVPLFESLKYGEVGGPLDINAGFAFFKRSKMTLMTASHILVSWKGAAPAPGLDPSKSTVTRSKEEAKALADQYIGQINQNAAQFEVFASTTSDDVMTRERKGALGVWFDGGGLPAFEKALKGVQPSAIASQPVETEYGYHILRRNPIPPEAIQD